MSIDGLFVLAIILHLATIILGGILIAGAARRGSGIGLILFVFLLMQAIPIGALLMYSMGSDKGAALYLGFAFGPLGAVAAVLWLLVGFGVSMFVTKK